MKKTNQRRHQRTDPTGIYSSPADFLDAVRAKMELRSDYQLAARLGMNQQSVSRYRKGTSCFDADASMKIADALELPHEFVFAKMEEFRARHDEHRAVWKRTAELIQRAMKDAAEKGFHVIGALAIALGLASAPTPSSASTLHNQNSQSVPAAKYLTEIHIARRFRQRGRMAIGALLDWLRSVVRLGWTL